MAALNILKNVNIRGYKPNTDVHIGQLKRAIKLLNKAKRPLFLAGGGVVISRAHEIFREVVEKTKVPVVTTVMGKGSIPTDHPLYIGNLGMHVPMQQTWQSATAMCCSPSEPDSMTESPETS